MEKRTVAGQKLTAFHSPAAKSFRRRRATRSIHPACMFFHVFVDENDAFQIHLAFVQAREELLAGNHPITKEEYEALEASQEEVEEVEETQEEPSEEA